MKWLVRSILLVCFSHFGAYAQEKTLSINIVAPELPPLVTQHAQQAVSGLFIDTFNQVAQQSQLRFHVEVVPWARALQLVINNQADAIMPALLTKERAQSLVYPSQPLINFYSSVLIKRASDDYIFTGFENITTSKSIAIVRAMSLGQEFERSKDNPLVRIIEVSKLEDALNMLLHQRVDLVAADPFIADDIIAQMSIASEISEMVLAKAKESSYLAFSKQFAERHDIEEIMRVISQFNNPDDYQKKLSTP